MDYYTLAQSLSYRRLASKSVLKYTGNTGNSGLCLECDLRTQGAGPGGLLQV